ncbi:MAG: TAT-variant-translocated molybdopterin oxidoreductase [Planctomycetota bacterium]
MSTIDRCPSKADLHEDASASELTAREVSAATGKAYWKSLDDLAGTDEFQSFVHREFPAQASELLDSTRRGFLKLMGASLALAGAATIPACRRPDHKILPYADEPEHIIHGTPLYYATALPIPGGGAEGVLVETFEGRPTKLEGNPLHPRNKGTLSVYAQASILDLYDPDRDPVLINELRTKRGEGPRATGIQNFRASVADRFVRFDATGGEELVFLVEDVTSPTRDRLIGELKRRWPGAQWFVDPERRGVGSPHAQPSDLSRADVVLTLDDDFLGDAYELEAKRTWGEHRIREGDTVGSRARETRMSRLYTVESRMSVTGGQADHRVAVRPSLLPRVALAIAKSVAQKARTRTGGQIAQALRGVQVEPPVGVDPAWIEAVATDLAVAAQRGPGSAVVRASMASPWLAALATGINMMLGVDDAAYTSDLSRSGSIPSLLAFAQAIAAPNIETVVVIGSNPAFTAPPGLGLVEALERVPELIVLGGPNETAEIASRDGSAGAYLARSHALEAWGDAQDHARAYSVVQPMIRPLFDTMSDLELLATIALAGVDGRRVDAYELVRDTARAVLAGTDFETAWKRTVHDGVAVNPPALRGAARNEERTRNEVILRAMNAALATPAEAPDAESIELVVEPDRRVQGGRFANNGWLQELPDAVTKVTWDNPVLMNAATAERLGLRDSRKLRGPEYSRVDRARVAVTEQIGGQAVERTIEAPIWISPGMADGVVIAQFGQGRTVGGRVARGTGIDVCPLLTAEVVEQGWTSAVSIERAGGSPYLIASTQDHWSMEGRALVREVDLPAWREFGDTDYQADKHYGKDNYGNRRDVNFAATFGPEGHTPANRGAYQQDQHILYTEVLRDERGRPVKDPVTGGPMQLREKTVQRDSRGRVLVDDDGNAVPVDPGEDFAGWPTKSTGEMPKTDTDRNKYWGRVVGKLNDYGRRVQQWGMTIDLTKCTGCSGCITACQAENNIPIVGKVEIAKGREMHWLRIDRYYAGGDQGDGHQAPGEAVDMVVQPVTCLHCENAPCEVVCPVNATVHGPEGTNNMSYNRCIGTRYCSNNCPYKVRRFNYFDYATKQFEGNIEGVGVHAKGNAIEPASDHRVVGGPDNPGATLTRNDNFVPPRFREKVAEVTVLKNNPHVTVRSRGVMEKCTYCVQRINQARYETKLQDLDFIPDGFFKAACESACATGAIVFGDIYDTQSNGGKGSAVLQQRQSQRGYELLGYLNARPRTTHMLRVRNPNPDYIEMLAAREPEDRKDGPRPNRDRQERWSYPWWEPGDPHGGHGHGSDHHGDDHSDHSNKDGHVMSLPVLGQTLQGALA